MKRFLLGLPVFFAAFLIGYFVVPDFKMTLGDQAPPQTFEGFTQPNSNAGPVTPSKKEKDFVPEFRDLPNFDILQFPELPERFIDLHNTNGLVRKSETVAKNGENWRVMFETDGKYTIRRSTAKVSQLRSISYPGEETDTQVSFPGLGRPIFAFKNIANVTAGPVTTVYLQPTWDEIDTRNLPIKSMETGFKRDLNLNENWYTLRVSTGETTDGEKVGVLVLENKGVQRVIARNYYDKDFGTIIGSLLWAGDIDNDGKLDLYFDEFNEKGYFSGGFYLSSHADEGELVKLIAMFTYGGC